MKHRIKYEATDGTTKEETVAASSLEEAVATIKDLKRVLYHISEDDDKLVIDRYRLKEREIIYKNPKNVQDVYDAIRVIDHADMIRNNGDWELDEKIHSFVMKEMAKMMKEYVKCQIIMGSEGNVKDSDENQDPELDNVNI